MGALEIRKNNYSSDPASAASGSGSCVETFNYTINIIIIVN